MEFSNTGFETINPPEGIEKEELGEKYNALQQQLNEATRENNSERMKYYQAKMESLKEKGVEHTGTESLIKQSKEYAARLNEAQDEGNEEKANFYKKKVENTGKELSFGATTLYELRERRIAEEKYNRNKKMTDKEAKKYMETHPTTLYEIQKLDKLKKQKK